MEHGISVIGSVSACYQEGVVFESGQHRVILKKMVPSTAMSGA